MERTTEAELKRWRVAMSKESCVLKRFFFLASTLNLALALFPACVALAHAEHKPEEAPRSEAPHNQMVDQEFLQFNPDIGGGNWAAGAEALLSGSAERPRLPMMFKRAGPNGSPYPAVVTLAGAGATHLQVSGRSGGVEDIMPASKPSAETGEPRGSGGHLRGKYGMDVPSYPKPQGQQGGEVFPSDQVNWAEMEPPIVDLLGAHSQEFAPGSEEKYAAVSGRVQAIVAARLEGNESSPPGRQSRVRAMAREYKKLIRIGFCSSWCLPEGHHGESLYQAAGNARMELNETPSLIIIGDDNKFLLLNSGGQDFRGPSVSFGSKSKMRASWSIKRKRIGFKLRIRVNVL